MEEKRFKIIGTICFVGRPTEFAGASGTHITQQIGISKSNGPSPLLLYINLYDELVNKVKMDDEVCAYIYNKPSRSKNREYYNNHLGCYKITIKNKYHEAE